MIFVIMIAGYKDLPQTSPSFGIAPVSTWKHAGEDGDSEEWRQWDGDRTFHEGKVIRVLENSRYDVEATGTTPTILSGVRIRHSKPLQAGDKIIAVVPKNGGAPKFQGIGNGCTFTDLIAPFFVFIVGVAIPLSRRRGWKHVSGRALMLIGAGVLYISLALKGISWWWGILQAIGVSYFMGAAFLLLAAPIRCAALLGIIAVHASLSWYIPWWTHLPADMTHGFFTLSNPAGDRLAPLNVHCTPWASIGYGIVTIVGTFVGETLVQQQPTTVLRRCAAVGLVCAGSGYLIHRLGIPMNKDNVSVSYSLFTAGIGALAFLPFYWIIDVKGFKSWAWPLNVFGTNPLLGYFLQPLVRILFVQLGIYALFTGRSGWVGMGWGLLWTFILWSVCLWCNKRNIYWKL